MSLNLLPRRPPTVGVSLDAAPPSLGTLGGRLDWAASLGFAGVELNATGELSGFHAPEMAGEVREAVRERLTAFQSVVVQAPHQETFDVTLVSPSSAIRRASLSELWAVCRFARAVGASVVTVRTGMPPPGVGNARRDGYLSECLQTLDRTAGEMGVRVGVLNRDRFHALPAFDDLTQLPLAHTGLALDIAHAGDLGRAPADLAAFLAARADRLVCVRAASAPSADPAPVADALRESGYGGPVLLSPTEDHAASDEELVAARRWWETVLAAAPGSD